MDLMRNTRVVVYADKLASNVRDIIQSKKEYSYHFGVVKADCYGLGIECVDSIIEGGCNYLAVATLDEALEIREVHKDIPILCLGVIPKSYLCVCKEKNITITIGSLEYLEEIDEEYLGLKVHVKVNTGMNRLGISSVNEIKKVFNLLEEKKMEVEGIYTHIYDAENSDRYNAQLKEFKEFLDNVDKDIKIVHIAASEALVRYPKTDFVNGCRLGIMMYGFTSNKSLCLSSVFSLVSEVIQIHELEIGEVVGYNGAYQAHQKEKIAVVPIGYADGIIRKNSGRNVYINGKRYPIVGSICMDMLFVKVDDEVSLHNDVFILKDNEHIEEVSKHLGTIPYEVMCSIGKRVPRIYKK